MPNSVSSSSTPSSGSPTDSNLLPINGESSKVRGKKSKSAKKPSKPRRRIQCASDLDSEDSSVSTDSPLKPKTYIKPLEPISSPTVEVVTPKSTRIPKKKKEPEVLQKTEEITSLVEELPLIPKGFLEQKKKLEDFEAKKREQEAKERLDANNAELAIRETERKENDRKVKDAEDRKEVESKLKSFKHLKENLYLCPRKVNKQSKKMQCDCTLSKEEVHQGETGCGDDCLNRLLYIECGKVCQLESNCSNKRFQNNDNANIEVFKTDWKGFGIRARGFIPKDTFLMEYVGEVLDNKQFRKRAKQYAKDDVQHFYFMALSKDFYVDATSKGNISRFINHSCDPNAETQKWTVNGELRVGFFTKRAVTEGEELSFDYRFERYGNVAQKCYCGTSRCRGWLGGEPGSDSGIEEMDEWSSSEEEQEDLSKDSMAAAEIERKKKKKKRPAKKIKNFEVDEFEEEVERISSSGIRNKLQTVQLCRLMVRATRLSTRLKLAELLLEADPSCLRLFLDYQGVRILSHWMFELEWSQEEMELKLRTEAVLSILNIPHKTMLVDSRVLQTVQRWSTDSPGGERKDGSVEVDSQPQSTAATPNQSRANSPTSSVPMQSVEGVCSTSEEKVSPLISQEMENTEAVDMEIDTEENQICEEEEPSPPGEDHFQTGEETLPPTEEPILQSDMPGCVEQGVSEAMGGEGEAMVSGEQVCSIMKAQAGVADDQQASVEVESEQIEEDDKVKPVQREQLPLTEEEEKQREQMGGQVTKVEISEEEKLVKEIQERAKELLEIWSTLQEVFKIPKKERQAVRREHEREADRSWGGWGGEAYTDTPESRLAMLQANAKLYATMQSNTGGQERGHHRGRAHQGYSRGYQAPAVGYQENQGVMRGGYTGGRVSSGGPPTRERRNLRLDDRTGRLSRANLYRDDRRMLFQAKVEEENRQKVLREALSARHNQCCRLLGMDPATTPMLNKYPEFYLSVGKWIPMPEPPLPIDPSWTTPVMAALPPQAFKPGDPPLPNPRSIYPPGICPERPPSPQPVSDYPSESYQQVCAYFDQLYYGASKSPRATHPASTSPSPSPIPQKSRRSRSPGHSGPNSPSMLSPSSFPINFDLSPDYRSPSPVHRSRSISPAGPIHSSNESSRPAPTSIPFLSSSPAMDELLPTRQRSQLSPLSTDAPLSPTSHSDTQTVVHTQTNREADSALIVKLPPKWKSARDSSGRVYYYHSVSRVTQWDPPSQEQEEEDEEVGNYINNEYSMETADTDEEEDRSEDGDDTDTEDDSEEESEDTTSENGGENKEEAEDGEIPDSDLSASEKRMLLRMRGRTKEERTNMRRMKKERDKERREQERLVSRERHTRHRRDGLVEEHLVPARISEKDKADLMTFKEMRERLLNKDKIREQQLKEEKEEDEKERREEKARQDKVRKEERRAAEKIKREAEFRSLAGDGETVGGSVLVTPEPSQATPIKVTPQPSSSSDTPTQSTPASSKKTTQAAADTSSDVEKKHKEKFVKEMSKVVVKILDPYRKKGVRGHISNTDDFKHLAKKLTYSITHKELKHCKAAEELKATEKVKKKASEYVSKYMKKYDREYKKSPDQDS